MLEYTITEENSIKCITPKGRLDALTSPDIQKAFDNLILAGNLMILVDLTHVNYVSSAGLRAFIMARKELKKVGGEIILFGMADRVFQVFELSGLTGVFRIAADREQVRELVHTDSGGSGIVTAEVDGIVFEYLEGENRKGSLFVFGSESKMEDSSYSEQDVVPVRAASVQFACGLGALGDIYDEYSNLFGESIVADGSFFFYPAVRHPSVDFLINARRDPDITYKFLHGFGFNGPYRYTLSFQGKEQAVEVASLLRVFFNVSRADVLGIALIGESKGLWGMHLRKVPLLQQKPVNGKSIFDNENFTDWLDFPVEPSFVNHIIVATGIAVREGVPLSDKIRLVIAGKNNFHLHAAVLEKAPMSSTVEAFDQELSRLVKDLQVYKIQHILGRSTIARGMAALVELEE